MLLKAAVAPTSVYSQQESAQRKLKRQYIIYQRIEKNDNKVDIFSIGMMGLKTFGVLLEHTMYGSQHFDTRVRMYFESGIQSASAQEKAMALRALQILTAY